MTCKIPVVSLGRAGAAGAVCSVEATTQMCRTRCPIALVRRKVLAQFSTIVGTIFVLSSPCFSVRPERQAVAFQRRAVG